MTNERLIIFAFISLAIILSPVVTQPAFADRFITYEDKVDMKKETLAKALTDFQDYPKIFPQYIKSVKLIDSQKHLAEMKVTFPFSSDWQIRYNTLSDGKYIIEVISGDLKGTKMTTDLKEIPGFDGTPNGGTKVTMDLALQLPWFYSIFVSDDSIRSGLDLGLHKFENYAKMKRSA
ncbi:MAG: hypothetical protein ACRD9Q_09495 [Nitrososphaeraceae archaeon]